MRVLYLYQYFSTPEMAGGTRSYEIARHLVSRGHEVHMVTSDLRGGSTTWRETDEAGIRVHWYPVANQQHDNYPKRLRAFVRFAWAAARRAASLPADVVFATSTPLTIALPAVWAARRKKVPMVFEVRDLWPEMPIAVGALRSRVSIAAARQLERFAYRNAEHIIALAPGMKEGIAATGYPSDRITVIPNMCDLHRFQVEEQQGFAFRRARPWLLDRPLVVFAGSLGFANGVDYLARLAAATRTRDPEIRFLVIGLHRGGDKIRRVARELGVLEQNFFVEPTIPKSEMPSLLSAADISTCLLLNIRELWTNSPNKVFDALAAGRPVAINHQHGWLADLIRETGCGLVLDPEDVNSAAEMLISSIRDNAWQANARIAASRLARERFNRDTLVAQWEAAVLGAVENGRTQQQPTTITVSHREAA
ncbi:MAG: glycosyltransferase family 4 protein [Pirellulales bacterium]|nr:glycosyltransferase family 4 protein [Pirellulales bacterium]